MSNRVVAVTSNQNKMERADIVIVGNGIAGLTAALKARSLEPNVTIAMITEQSHPTINTPALKQFAVGKVAQEQLLTHPPGMERAQRIHIINARVDSIHAQSKYVGLRGGYGFGYGSLLLATGSVPNGLPPRLPGRNFDGVLTLHNLQDYLNFRRRLPEVDTAVVIGGGTHAIETAMGLLHYGIEVHWLIRGDTFLPKMLDHVASELVLDNVRSAGIHVHTETEAIGIVGRVGSVAGVVTNQHNMIPCQLVLTCTGTLPATTLANQCDVPMLHNRGIFVDQSFSTSVQDVYAAGDVAARKNPITGFYETHAQWYAAVSQGRAVAAAMTGHVDLTETTQGASWHATHLGELFMLTVGNPLSKLPGIETLTEGGKKKYCRMSIVNDQLIGYLSLGATQPDSLAIKHLIDDGVSVESLKKALLKGSFDVRRHFSGWSARAAHEMVTSGKLPALIGSIVNSRASSKNIASPAAMVTQPSQDTMNTPPMAMPILPLHHDTAQTSINDTGKHQTEPLSEQIEQNEEATPLVTGKLLVPAQSGIGAKLLALPSRNVTRNLWSYTAEVPVVKVDLKSESKVMQP